MDINQLKVIDKPKKISLNDIDGIIVDGCYLGRIMTAPSNDGEQIITLFGGQNHWKANNKLNKWIDEDIYACEIEQSKIKK